MSYPVLHNISLEEIGKALGISKATVSRALSGRGRISTQTVERVKAYVRYLNSRKNRQDRSSISVVMPSDTYITKYPYFNECLLGISETAANLICDPNWDAGFARWQCERTANATAEILPEFIEPFPAPPHNAVRIEGEQNFTCYLSQAVALPRAGRWQLQAEIRGADTTGVEIYLRLQSEAQAGCRTQVIVHPTEHEWQKAAVQLELPAGGARAGLSVVSPPGYTMVRHFALTELPPNP